MTIFPQINTRDLNTWSFIKHVKAEETSKKIALQNALELEAQIASFIVQEFNTAHQKNPKAKQIEITVSQKLKKLLMAQSYHLQMATVAAKKEAQLEKAIYNLEEKA